MKDVPPKHDLTEPRPWIWLFLAYSGWITILAAIVAIGVTLFSVVSYQSAARFERVGVVIDAEVTSLRIDRSGDDDSYYATFRFDADGLIVSRERGVSRTFYREADQGDLVEIRYLPDDPRNFETYVGQKRRHAVVSQAVAGVAGLISLLTLWILGQKANRAVLARRLGHRTVAVVQTVVETKVSGRPSGKGYMVWRTADGVRGESLTHPIGKLRAIGEGAQINVYVRRKHSVWEGDVGPRVEADSNLPRVPRI